MLSVIEYLPRPCFSLRVFPDTWTVRAGQVEVLRFLSVPFTSLLVATSTVVVEEGGHTLHICLGADDAFSPPVTARTVQPANMSQWVSSGREPTIAASAMFVINSAPALAKTATVVTKVIGAVVGISVIINPGGITSMQGVAMVLQMPCMKPSVKAIAKEASWTLSPLAAVAPAMGSVPSEVNMLLWNVVALVFFGLSHYGVVLLAARLNQEGRKGALVTLMYPHASLTAAMVLYQGTTFAAYRSIWHMDLAFLPLTLTYQLVFSWGMPIASWWWVRTNMELKWTPNHTDITFAPRGIWLPTDTASRYGLFFNDFDGDNKHFTTVVLVYSHGMALVTSLQPTTDTWCEIQLWVCFVATFLMACAFLYLRPLRWTVANIARAGTLITQAAQLLSSAAGASDNVEASINLLLMGACLFEGILGAAIMIREYCIQAQLEQNRSPAQVDPAIRSPEPPAEQEGVEMVQQTQQAEDDLLAGSHLEEPLLTAKSVSKVPPKKSDVRSDFDSMYMSNDTEEPDVHGYDGDIMTSRRNPLSRLSFPSGWKPSSETIVTEEPVVHGYEGDIMTSRRNPLSRHIPPKLSGKPDFDEFNEIVAAPVRSPKQSRGVSAKVPMRPPVQHTPPAHPHPPEWDLL